MDLTNYEKMGVETVSETAHPVGREVVVAAPAEDLLEFTRLPEVALTESYDVEMFGDFKTFCDFEVQSFKRHFVECVTARGGGRRLG